MREVDIEDTKFYRILNKMYEEFNHDGYDAMIPFTNHVRKKYGIHLNIRPNLERGPGQYDLTRVFVEDEARYNWLILEWT